MLTNVLVFEDHTEAKLLLSTYKATGITFGTQIPGGFAEGTFTLPEDQFNISTWKDLLLGTFVVFANVYGERMYEGSVEGINDADAGLAVQCAGLYSKSGLKTAYLTYPSTPVDLTSAATDAAELISEWRSLLVEDISGTWQAELPLEFLYEVKVQSMLEDITKNYLTDTGSLVRFAVYDNRMAHLFHVLYPWFKASRHDFTLTYGETISLTGTYNKIQVLYDVNGETNFTDWYNDVVSQARYGIREGSLSAGQVPAGIAQVAGELAITRYAKPNEQRNITITGSIKSYGTDTPTEVYRLRAGHMIFVSDLPADPDSRFAFEYDKVQAGFLVTRTNYTADNDTLTIDTGDNVKSLENYLADMGITGGNVQ